jgi:Ca-activated chloride channel homolog
LLKSYSSMSYGFGKAFGYRGVMRRVILAGVLGAGLMIFPAPGLAQDVAPAPPPMFRAGVDLVTVTATVRDGKGRLVRDLSARDFEVLDRGARRPISGFRADRAPVSLAILFDVSGSMDVAARMTAAKFAAHHLLSWLDEGRDEAALFAFDSGFHEVAPFTVNTRALQGELGVAGPFGATSLHDAIAEAAARVAARPAQRRAVVVLTDGIDTASRMSPAEVSAKAAAIDVPIYVIATVLSIDDPDSDRATPQTHRAVPASVGTIADLARWTGGALYYSSTSASASLAARSVIDELRQMYLIAFEPGADAGWHPIEIRTKKKDLVVRARGGYVAGR